MANIKSSIKRAKTNEKKRLDNVPVKSRMKNSIKRLFKTEDKKEALRIATKAIDKAAKKGIIKKETAARKKSRLAKQVNMDK